MVDDKDNFERLRELYPTLSEGELRTAEVNLRRYLEIVARVYEDVCEDPVRYAKMQESLKKEREERERRSSA